MPQLVKGGKYVFGWCCISKDSRILIPEEARKEYQLKDSEKVFLLPGSKTSGGFSIVRKPRLEQSKFSNILIKNPDLAEFKIKEGEIVDVGTRSVCWTTIRANGHLLLLPHMLEVYGIKQGDNLLVIRGSNIGIGIAVRGPIIEEARRHPDIQVFHAIN